MKCTIGKKRHWYPTAVFLRFGPVGLNISSEKHEPLLTGVYPFVPAQRQNYFLAFSSHQNHIPLKDASGQQQDETDKCFVFRKRLLEAPTCRSPVTQLYTQQ